MKTPSILLIGGTGKTGKRVTHQLEARGVRYCLATRKPQRPEDRFFDWQQPVSDNVFEGVSSVYLVAPTHTSEHQHVVTPVLQQALAMGVMRFVLLSASSLEEGGPMMGQIHAFLRQNAPEWCVLRPTWFMQNLSEQHHQATIQHEGKIYSATGSGRIGFIDAQDIARCAVAALLAPQAPNRDFILTGPETLSYDDVASRLTSTLGYTVEHVRLTVEQLARRYEASGMDTIYAQLLASLDEGISQGAEDRLTEGVLALTGHSPVTISQFMAQEQQRWTRG